MPAMVLLGRVRSPPPEGGESCLPSIRFTRELRFGLAPAGFSFVAAFGFSTSSMAAEGNTIFQKKRVDTNLATNHSQRYAVTHVATIPENPLFSACVSAYSIRRRYKVSVATE